MEYIWVSRWAEFQHYKPERSRGPGWIKAHTAQLDDARYLELTDRQRALLHDLRMLFAVTRSWLPRDSRVISRHRHRQTFRKDLEALNHAGFIQFISRETLELALEELYSRSRSTKELKDQTTNNGSTTTEHPAVDNSRKKLADLIAKSTPEDIPF